MPPRIAIPQAHSTNIEFTTKCMPQYVHAVELAGGIAVEIPVNVPNAEIMRITMTCDGVLLPGSPADINPERYGRERHPKTAPDDPARDNADELLLQDAYNMHKPVLGICFGLQSLNTWRTGTLIQHLETGVQHTKGEDQPITHEVRVAPDSQLAHILQQAVCPSEERSDEESLSPPQQHRYTIVSSAAGPSALITTNTSHHQAVETPGHGLIVVAWSAKDNVIEAVEGTSGDHFIIGVQWHPERTVDADPYSRAIFQTFVDAARTWHSHPRTPSPDFESV